MSIQIQSLAYRHSDKTLLFQELNFSLPAMQKANLIGNNGCGKSTFLRILAGEIKDIEGTYLCSSLPYYIPQHFGQFSEMTVAEALNIDKKILALHAILDGSSEEIHFEQLDDDWTIEDRVKEAFSYWKLSYLTLNTMLQDLSGGEKTKVFLAGILIHEPDLLLLDEPTNHLDQEGRTLLYQLISRFKGAALIVSHDRQLLNLQSVSYELSDKGLQLYSGNYDFYAVQKEIENNALQADIHNKEKALRKAKEKERETIERQQKLDSKGKKKQEKAGVARIMMNTLRNKAENSSSKLKSAHGEKIENITGDLQALRSAHIPPGTMKLDLSATNLHKGKILFTAENMNLKFQDRWLWKDPLSIQIRSGERVAIKGRNGSGKTTLLNVILGKTLHSSGTLQSSPIRSIYIDQEYSLIKDAHTVYEQAQEFNISALQEHEVKTRLNRFLFTKEDWEKPCKVLSGGERMRLLLCCLTIQNQVLDMIILDEPTNNLDIRNIEILTQAMKDYSGTLLVVSHDTVFLEHIQIDRIIELK